MQITLAEGLVQLKRITARIEKKVGRLDLVTVTVGGKIPHLTVSPEEYSRAADADLQSVRALIERRRAIKGAIVLANALTQIKVGGREMTIAEAIERKMSIKLDRDLLLKLRTDQAKTLVWLKDENASVQKRLDAVLSQYDPTADTLDAAGKFKAVAEPFLNTYEARLHDPLSIDGIIRDLDDEIDLFNEEIDIALTEANVRTVIQIPGGDETSSGAEAKAK